MSRNVDIVDGVPHAAMGAGNDDDASHMGHQVGGDGCDFEDATGLQIPDGWSLDPESEARRDAS